MFANVPQEVEQVVCTALVCERSKYQVVRTPEVPTETLREFV